jgi:sortase A
MTDYGRDGDNPAQQDLETLLMEKRRRRAMLRFRRVAAAEEVLEEALFTPTHEEPFERAPTMAPADRPIPMDWAASMETVARARPAAPPLTPAEPRTRRRMRGRDRLLLVVEIGALLGSLMLVVVMYSRLQTLNHEIRDLRHGVSLPIDGPLARQVPTEAPVVQPAVVAPATATRVAAPLPEPTATMLPGPRIVVVAATNGHQEPAVQPSLSDGDTHEAERHPRRMVIPRIGVDAPVVRGDTWEDLKWGIGHRVGSAYPGEPGNVVVSAHNDAYGEIFRHLNRLEPGDEILLYTRGDVYRYQVRGVEIVMPNQVDVMDPTVEPVLTMITCYPYLINTYRIVVVADLVTEDGRP